jgi:hypothetical protein
MLDSSMAVRKRRRSVAMPSRQDFGAAAPFRSRRYLWPLLRSGRWRSDHVLDSDYRPRLVRDRGAAGRGPPGHRRLVPHGPAASALVLGANPRAARQVRHPSLALHGRRRRPEQIVGWFVRRWGLEVTFEEARRHLGVETQRQ